MKKNISKTELMIVLTAFVISSCEKSENKRMKGEDEIQFTSITAEKNVLQAGESTRITATIQNACPAITYTWNTSTGTISGNNSRVTFISPDIPARAEITCTANHPGRQPRSRSITIDVQ